MKLTHSLAVPLLLAGVIVLALVVGAWNVRSAAGGVGTDIGGAIMMDPHGDVELARKVLAGAEANGIPQVILSRKVIGGNLPCLGFAGMTSIEQQPTVTFGVVVLAGDMIPNFPGEWTGTFPYMEYFYDLQNSGITGVHGGALGSDWGSLRALYGSSDWPTTSPMYLSPDGQPSGAELDAPTQVIRGEVPRGVKLQGQDVNKSQSVGGWTVTLQRVYAQGAVVWVDYSLTGPTPRTTYSVDSPLLTASGVSASSGAAGNLQSEVMGPGVDQVTFYGLPASLQPQDMAMSFVVPAIHVRPPQYPCEIQGLKPEQYPTPTPIPNNIEPGCCSTTPEPDVQTVGPFIFDLNVHVEPAPTQPIVPTDVPTIQVAKPPPPVSTGQP